MEGQVYHNPHNGKKLIILGFIVIGILFFLYSRYQDPELLTPGAVEIIQRMAYAFYIILIACFGAIAYGIHLFHKEKAMKKEKDLTSIIAIVTFNKKSKKIFFATFSGYGIFFALASGTLVYQPEINFSYHYGVDIPSGFVAPCCDGPGYMPKILVYLTEHLGLQVIPINLLLQIVVSFLVGLNIVLALNAYRISKKGSGASTVGAITGLFIACPTCAGSFLSIFVGTASGLALTLALIQLQTVFIAISIPVLLATPYLLARKLKNPDGSCKISPSS